MQRDLADVLADFATAVASRETVSEILHRLGDYFRELLPVDSAGVLLVDSDGRLRVATTSDDLGAEVERLEVELQEGPCTRCFREGEQVAAPDLSEDKRFPRFAPRALSLGIRGIHALPMTLRTQRLGVVDLITRSPLLLGHEDIARAQLLADVAMAYIVNSRAFAAKSELAEQLQHALESRVLIEQAKGVLAEQLGVPPDAAFEVLRRRARGTNRKARDVAYDVIAGRLDLS